MFKITVIAILSGLLAGCVTSPDSDLPRVVNLPVDKPLTVRNTPTLALSPDGDTVVYPADTENGDNRQLYLYSLTNGTGRFLDGTVGGELPFFSPDGRWLGFFADEKLKRVSISGGNPEIVCDAPAATGGYWGTDNRIIFADGTVWQVPSIGGEPQQVTAPLGGEIHSWPSILPGGNKIMYNVLEQGKPSPAIIIQDLDTGTRWKIIEEGSYPRYLEGDYLIYTDSGNLMAAEVDPGTVLLKTKPALVQKGVLMSPSTGAAQYAISGSGSIIFVEGGIFGRSRRVVMLDRDGNEHDTGLPPRRYSYVKYSPDGSKLALEIEEEESAIWIYDLETGTQVKKLADGSYPVWTPGGTHITFTGFRSGSPGLYRVSLDNPDNIEELFVGNYPINHSYTWSGDEQVLVFTEVHPVTGMNVLALKKPDMRDPLSILASPSQECCPAISPDDRWLAYVSDESGRPEIYVTSFPDRRTTHRVSSSGGREPVWSHRENILYYWQDRQLMMVDLTDETALDNAVPVRLFEGVFVSSTSTWRSRYDVHPGGNRFVILKRGPEEMGVTILKKIQDFHKLIRNRPGGEI